MNPRVNGSGSAPAETVEVGGPAGSTPVVFVHGAGISRQMWRPQLEGLSGEFRVVAFDLPGHGTLAERRFEFDGAVERLADVVADLDERPALVRPAVVPRPHRQSGPYVSGPRSDRGGDCRRRVRPPIVG